MKKPWLAFLLNFLFAGAGLAYLGKWKWAALNLVCTLAVGFVVAYYAASQVSVISAVIGALNGGIASSIAKSMNAKQDAQPVPAQTQS